MREENIRHFFRVLFSMLLLDLLVYLALGNLAPYGSIRTNMWDKGVSKPIPKQRVMLANFEGEKVQRQIDDLVYFNVEGDKNYDQAQVKIVYYNPFSDQDIFLGFKDQQGWHYSKKPVEASLFNNLNWNEIRGSVRLLQRHKDYSSVEDFFRNPPKSSAVGKYFYDGISDPRKVDNYRPNKNWTVINTPIRGSHNLYTYLRDEPFSFKFIVQDLNWYQGRDVLRIKVFKDGDLVTEKTLDDDGIEDSSKSLLPSREIVVQNPGPDLPENGVYKIEIQASGDIIIRQIITNLSKLSFEGSVFSVANGSVYSGVITSTEPTILFTDSPLVSAKTMHPAGVQDVNIDNKLIELRTPSDKGEVTTGSEIARIVAPKSDTIIEGPGYFAFDKNSLFTPDPFIGTIINNEEDTKKVDYILTTYQPPIIKGDWKTSELTFDLRSAVWGKNKLEFLLEAPGLKEKGREILIKDIEVKMIKKAWLNK